MKLTKQEQAALDRASRCTGLLTDAGRKELAQDPNRNAYRIRLDNLQRTLVIRAEELNRRMLHNGKRPAR